MDWLKGLAAPSLGTAIWAFMLFHLGKHAVSRFEAAITKAIDRLRKLGPAEFEPPPQPSSGEGLPALAENQLPEPHSLAPNSFPAKLDSSLRTWLASVPEHERMEQLIRHNVAWQIAWTYEALNFFILGSQIALLQALNSSDLPLAAAHDFYDRGVSAEPHFYAKYAFERWLSWLQEFAELIEVNADMVRITEKGSAYLTYMTSRRYPVARYG